jgi:hypothetical protein
MRNILLLEPNHKNKYPPLGLMKLSTYYKKLGDNVQFYKGDLKEFILNNIYKELEKKLNYIDDTADWFIYKKDILQFIKTDRKKLLEEILDNFDKNKPLILENLKYYSNFYKKKEYLKYPKYDKVCIATLFTFYWNKTIETIEFAKGLVKDYKKDILIGGVMASVLPKEIEEATGIKPIVGLLDKAGILDDNDIIIDELPLDYSLLDEIDYTYPESNGYYGYMTRGCKRKCPFCAVPTIEPKYKSYISLKNNIEYINKHFGEQRNLLLLDNNVLASKDFSQIIDEIVGAGFYKGAKYIEPNWLDITISNLKKSINNVAYTKKGYYLLQEMLKRLKGENQQFVYNKLDEFQLLKLETTTKENLLKIYPLIKDIYEKYRNKAPKNRYVDFNQGVDARYLTEEKVKLLSQIPIKPLRIAFDELRIEKQYVKAIELSAKYGIKNLSNYLLYNYKDKPEELYIRMKINVELCEKLDVNIYSFPMKYIPIYGDVSKNREFIGKYWNKKFIRAIQAVLNSTKGKIGRGKSFFEKAFGKNIDEFYKILYMPEPFIIYRLHFEKEGITQKWWDSFRNLNEKDKKIIYPIIEQNIFNIDFLRYNNHIKRVLEFYLIKKPK